MGQFLGAEEPSPTTNDQNSSLNRDDTKEPPQNAGTDLTYHVNDLLKSTTYNLKFSNSLVSSLEKLITKEELRGVAEGFLIHNLLSAEECKQLIEAGEQMGFAPSPLTQIDGINTTAKINADTRRIRDSERVLSDVPQAWVDEFARRLLPFLPRRVHINSEEWALKESGPLNERWRFNKYHRDQKFAPHFDAGFQRNKNEKTLMTFIVYLNEGFDGGFTTFFPEGKRVAWDAPNTVEEVRVVPRTSLAILFMQAGKHNFRHEGAPHHSDGQFKYIIRSDIVFMRVETL